MVPLAVVVSSARMMPVLEAREALELVNRLAIGTGSVPPDAQSQDEARRRMMEWRMASGLMPADPPKRKITAESLERLAKKGYQIVKVPKRGD